MSSLKDEDSPLRKGRWATLALAVLLVGCGITPRTFRGMIHPSAVGRARALAPTEGEPESVAVPRLIDQLQDPDPVVQLTANEELKRVTGQDFGFAAWFDADERKAAVGRWRAWWDQRAGTGSQSR